MRPIGIDLFAGVGGLSLGFEQAGFDVVAAVEYDPIHAAAHEYNFQNCKTIARSVLGLRGEEIRHLAGIRDRNVDVVFGGAPCQGFSLIGQRALDDPRNALVSEFVRIVSELEADYFVFENVKGLTVGKQRRFLDEIIEAFSRANYHVRMPWRVLNASAYGTPQDRERLILLGARKGKILPDYPAPAFLTPRAKHDLFELQRGPTCEDALGDVPDAEKYTALLESDVALNAKWKNPSAYGAEMRCTAPAAWHFGYKRNWDPTSITSHMRTHHSDISRRRFSGTLPGEVEPISRFFKLPPKGLSNTLRAGSDAARGAFTSPRPIHYKFPRCITVREMARLHGFPDWFRFHQTKWHGARQIGNAVPPPLARAIASMVLRAGGYTPRKPSFSLELGDPKLLQMDMSQASAHWGIVVPIGRRDRKSGVRKRKQEEIEAELSRTRHA